MVSRDIVGASEPVGSEESLDEEDTHLVSQLSVSFDDPDMAQVAYETAMYLYNEHKRIQRQIRIQTPPQTGSTANSCAKGRDDKDGKATKPVIHVRLSSNMEDPYDVCWNCGKPVTDAQGGPTIFWSTMFVSESTMSKRPCCSKECLIEYGEGKAGVPKQEMRAKWEQISKRTQSATSRTGQSYNTDLHAEGGKVQQSERSLGIEMSREGEASPSEDESDDPIATLHPDGTHSMGTVRGLPDRDKIRWKFNDQGVRYPTWLKEAVPYSDGRRLHRLGFHSGAIEPIIAPAVSELGGAMEPTLAEAMLTERTVGELAGDTLAEMGDPELDELYVKKRSIREDRMHIVGDRSKLWKMLQQLDHQEHRLQQAETDVDIQIHESVIRNEYHWNREKQSAILGVI